MRRISSLITIALAVLMLTVTLAAQSASATPLAVPVEPVKDFEIVPRGEIIRHAFEIRNDGDVPLEVTDVKPACGCTVAKYDKTIAPGEIGRVNVKLKTESFSGPIDKKVSVFTNDPENPKLQLSVKANVKPYIVVTPGFARFNYVRGEEIGTIAQTVWAEDVEGLEITEIKTPYDHLQVSFREATEAEHHEKGQGRQWRVEVGLDEDAPVGALRDYLEIRFNHPKQKFAKIPISGFVRPRQHITPEKIDLGKLEGDFLPLRHTFHLSSFVTERIDLTTVETGHDAISAEVQQSPNDRDKGYRFRIVLTIGPDMPKGEFDTKVKIHTTDSQSPVVELPVRGTVI